MVDPGATGPRLRQTADHQAKAACRQGRSGPKPKERNVRQKVQRDRRREAREDAPKRARRVGRFAQHSQQEHTHQAAAEKAGELVRRIEQIPETTAERGQCRGEDAQYQRQPTRITHLRRSVQRQLESVFGAN